MQHWIPLAKIENWLDLEPLVVGAVFTLLTWGFYRWFLKTISQKRHDNLQGRFTTIFNIYFSFLFMSLAYWGFRKSPWESVPELNKFFSYWVLIAVYIEAIFWILLAQVMLYCYLFFSHLKVGVPRLIANSFTFTFGAVLLVWLTSEVFGINVTHLLATSAIFSVVLGLALQDTLGNLFSGFALQIDRPYSIGDWIEVHVGDRSWQGVVQEINWRATLLIGFGDELINIPNKTMAQSQVLIMSHSQGNARCNQSFTIGLNEDIGRAKEILLQVFKQHPQVQHEPPPRPLVLEVNDSWVSLKIFYTVKDYAMKYRTGDELLIAGKDALQKNQIQWGHKIIDIEGR